MIQRQVASIILCSNLVQRVQEFRSLGVINSKTPKLSKLKKGQTILEYAIFVSVIVAALMTMAVYVKRSIQANLKQVEERVNAEMVVN